MCIRDRHDCALGMSPVTSYSGVLKDVTAQSSLHAEPPATCHHTTTEDVDAFRKCAPDAVIYGSPPGGSGESANATAVWTAAEDVVLDARYLFRGIHLERDLEIRGMTVAQVSLFVAAPAVLLLILARLSVDAFCASLDCAFGNFPVHSLFGCK